MAENNTAATSARPLFTRKANKSTHSETAMRFPLGTKPMIMPSVNPAASWFGESLANRPRSTLRQIATTGRSIRNPFRRGWEQYGGNRQVWGERRLCAATRTARFALWRLSTAAVRRLDSDAISGDSLSIASQAGSAGRQSRRHVRCATNTLIGDAGMHSHLTKPAQFCCAGGVPCRAARVARRRSMICFARGSTGRSS